MGLGSCVERQRGPDGVGDAAQPGQRQLKPRRPRPADGQMQHQAAIAARIGLVWRTVME
jgi:hypothetical protein